MWGFDTFGVDIWIWCGVDIHLHSVACGYVIVRTPAVKIIFPPFNSHGFLTDIWPQMCVSNSGHSVLFQRSVCLSLWQYQTVSYEFWNRCVFLLLCSSRWLFTSAHWLSPRSLPFVQVPLGLNCSSFCCKWSQFLWKEIRSVCFMDSFSPSKNSKPGLQSWRWGQGKLLSVWYRCSRS